MKLTDHEQAMLAGAEGPARKFAMEQIVKVGWLRLDPLLRQARTAADGDGRAHHRLRVLWAPTHNMVRGGNDESVPSSYPAFKVHEDDITPFFRYQVSLHPRQYSPLATFWAPTPMAR